MIGLGLKLNSAKTKASCDVVRASVKSDKLAWMMRKKSEKNFQKHLLIIHDHAMHFPNAGSLVVALSEYHKRITKTKRPIEQPMALIGIVVDIAYRNPRTYPVYVAILSKLLQCVQSEAEKRTVIDKIKRKFFQIPNTGHIEIWLQRITFPFANEIEYDEPVCKLVSGVDAQIWNIDWISSRDLKNAVNANRIIDRGRLRENCADCPV